MLEKPKYVKCGKCGVTRNTELATECTVCAEKINYDKQAETRKKLKKAEEIRQINKLKL